MQRDGGTPAILTERLTKRFGERAALLEVDLRVPQGVSFGFLGPNGAGKTTLIRSLLGLTHATGGRVSLMGREIPREKATALARVGAIVEEPKFHGHLTGRENMRIIAAARSPGCEPRIGPSLDRVGLKARADDRVSSYSLGMRQRLGVARCLMADPLLLILDEPMNGLDPAGMEEFREMIEALVGEGRTVFLSSHLVDEVEKTCERVAIIDQGRIVMEGPVGEIGRTGAPTFRVRCDDVTLAARTIEGHAQVASVSIEGPYILMTLANATAEEADRIIADINRELVSVGVSVFALSAERISLEARFLELTSRLQAAT